MKELIVPMLVEAFAVGNIRTSRRDVPVMAPNYKTVLANSVLGSKNTPGVFEKTTPLEPGIHLHFILPDAFTHSADGSSFPAVPNRFVVTRIWKESSADKLKLKCCVVESDYISLDSKYNESITIPFFGDTNYRKKWRYLGRTYTVENTPEADSSDAYLDKLTALGAGDPFFSSYYPNCRSVFGFYDDLKDIETGNVTLTYFVMGYFSNENNDPFSDIDNVEDFQKKLDSMNFSVDVSDKYFNQTVLYGSIDSIEWKGFDNDYYQIPDGKVNIVLANNSAEALSKAIKSTLDPNDETTERMITALQYELYDQTDKPDGNFYIDDHIHYGSFSRRSSLENNYRISAGKNGEDTDSIKYGNVLSEINEDSKQTGIRKRQLEYKRTVLYALWEQYIMLYEDEDDAENDCFPKEDIIEEMYAVIREIESIEKDLDCQVNDQKAKLDTISTLLPDDSTIESSGSENFFAPTDPVILLSGDGINRTFAFGEDGRFTSDATLRCQTTTVCANVSAFEIEDKCFDNADYTDKLPAIYTDLLIQTCLISLPVKEAIQAIIGPLDVRGDISSEIALNKNPLDFTTLYMIWEVEYSPIRTNQEQDDSLKHWELKYGDTNLVYKGDLTPSQLKQYNISGHMVLTPHAVKTFADVIDRYADIYDKQEEFKNISQKVKKLSVISQSISGFSEYFAGFSQSLQFPIMGIDDDDDLAKAVEEHISDNRVSVLPLNDLLPMHGGYIRITRLSLVSSFGLIQELITDSYYNKCEVEFAETISGNIKDYGLIPPSFSDFTRINADFVAADNNRLYTSSAPETSPVCGIIIPEILNRRLLAYTYDGVYAGMIKTVYRDKKPSVRWLSAPNTVSGFEEIDFKNDYFKEFLKSLLTIDNAFYEFNSYMDKFLDVKQSTTSLMWGKPLALIRLKMNFEFYAYPQFSKKFSDIKKYNTCEAEKIRFNLGFGDIGRITDGVFGCYDDHDFSKLYPAYGSENTCETENYMKYSESISISNNDGDRYFTLLAIPDSQLNIQSGILPVKTIQIEAAHTDVLENLSLFAEVSPVLSDCEEVGLPSLPQDDKDKYYKWFFYDKENTIEKKIVPPVASFEEKILMDGFILKEE